MNLRRGFVLGVDTSNNNNNNNENKSQCKDLNKNSNRNHEDRNNKSLDSFLANGTNAYLAMAIATLMSMTVI
ncbi:hypothetical protein ACHAXS_004470 [Conticribra weissflogii]